MTFTAPTTALFPSSSDKGHLSISYPQGVLYSVFYRAILNLRGGTRYFGEELSPVSRSF